MMQSINSYDLTQHSNHKPLINKDCLIMYIMLNCPRHTRGSGKVGGGVLV